MFKLLASILISIGVVIAAIKVSRVPEKSNVEYLLKKMPQEDKRILSDFFAALMERNCFGYTLMGVKPVSFENAFIAPPCGPEIFTTDLTSLFIWRAEKVWKKYESDIRLKNYALNFHKKKNILNVVLVHKPAFLKTVLVNLPIFRQILEITSPESFLESITRQDADWDIEINNNVVIEGVLLGFGTQNSMLYQRYIEVYNDIFRPLPPPWIDQDLTSFSKQELVEVFSNRRWRLIPEDKESHLVKPKIGSIIEEYLLLRKKCRLGANLRPFKQPLSRFDIPQFLIFDAEDEEIIKLMNTYSNTRKNLVEFYDAGDFLELTLKKLTGEL